MNEIDRYFMLDKLIESNLEEIKRLKALAAEIPIVDPGREYISGGDHPQCRFSNLVDKAVDLEGVLSEQIAEYIDCKKKLYTAFGKLKPVHELILRYRYLDNMTIEEIAEKMGCSIRNVYNLKCQAMSELFHFIS